MIEISVACMGHSGAYFPGGGDKRTLKCADGESVNQVLEGFGVNTDLFMYAIVNGEKRNLSYILKDGDDVLLVSPLMGG